MNAAATAEFHAWLRQDTIPCTSQSDYKAHLVWSSDIYEGGSPPKTLCGRQSKPHEPHKSFRWCAPCKREARAVFKGLQEEKGANDANDTDDS